MSLKIDISYTKVEVLEINKWFRLVEYLYIDGLNFRYIDEIVYFFSQAKYLKVVSIVGSNLTKKNVIRKWL